ncbi:MAG: AEC family transporter [Candidatus Omnitrophica bacterium]|nr:AEC family transporter [Candidatus Omnitrophota bacterium]
MNMIAEFYSVYSMGYAILKIFFMVAIGYILYTKRLVKKDVTKGLSNILIWVCIPALIFTKITSAFDPYAFPKWWVLPICSIGMSLVGLGLGHIFQRPMKSFSASREFTSSCAFQNSGYLPMTLVVFACSGDMRDKLLVYIFLFIMGFNIFAWSFLPAYLSKDIRRNFRLSAILNPPVIATGVSIAWVFILGEGKVHNVIYEPLMMLGNATFPLALIVLGSYLAEYRPFKSENWKALGICLLTKLIFLPAVVFILIKYLPLEESLKFFIMLEAIMPVAVSLIVIGQFAKADNKFFSGAIFYSHLLAIVTIPMWLLLLRNS